MTRMLPSLQVALSSRPANFDLPGITDMFVLHTVIAS